MPNILRMLPSALVHMIKRQRLLKEYANHTEYSPLVVRRNFCHEYATSFLKLFRVNYVIKGIENTNSDRCIFYSNHQSDIDAVLTMILFSKPISYLGKKEVAKMPIVSDIMKACDGEFLNRRDLRSEVISMRNIVRKMNENPNLGYIIFPEGQRTQDVINRTLCPFKPGAFKPAYLTKSDIVPMCLYGSYNCLNFKKKDKRVYPIQVTFMKPIKYEEYKDLTTIELSNKIQAMVEEELKKQRELQPILESFWNKKENAKVYKKDVKKRVHKYFKLRKIQREEDLKLEKEFRKTHERSKKILNKVIITKEDKMYFKSSKKERKQQKLQFIKEYEESKKK